MEERKQGIKPNIDTNSTTSEDTLRRGILLSGAAGIDEESAWNAAKSAAEIAKVLSGEIEKINESLNTTRKGIDNLRKKTEKNLKTLRSDIESKIEDRQVRAIEALGIFIALFTYISVSIQIFERISSAWSAGIFSLLFFCSLAVLIVLLDLLLIHPPSTLYKDFRFRLIAIFLMVGVAAIWALRGVPLNPIPATIEFEETLNNKVREEVRTQILETTYSKSQIDVATSSFTVFRNCIRQGGTVWACLD